MILESHSFVQYIIPPLFGCIAGIALFSVSNAFFFFFLLTVLFISGGGALVAFQIPSYRTWLGIGAVTLACVWAGGWYVSLWITPEEYLEERPLENESVSVVSEPDVREDSVRYTVELSDGIRALLTTDKYPRYSYGDTLSLTGELREPVVFPDFDYRSFLRKEGIDAVIYYPDIEKDGPGSLSFMSLLFSAKERIRDSVYATLPFPYNTIAGAMILGDGHRVPDSIGETFSATGIRHIIAISGMHVTIIAGLLIVFLTSFLGFGRDTAFWISAGLIALFVIFVGSPASALRAGIMAIIFLYAFKAGRIYSAPRALLIAAVVMLAFNPLLLAHDVGFQLSFLATLGIIWLAPFFERLFGRHTSFLEERLPGPDETASDLSPRSIKNGVISLLSVSIAAHLATLPIVAYTFGIVSFSAPIANLLAVPLIPLVIVSSGAAAFTGLISEFLGSLAGLPATAALWFITSAAEFLDSIPGGSIVVEIHWAWSLAGYALLAGVLLLIHYHRKKQEFTTATSLGIEEYTRTERPY